VRKAVVSALFLQRANLPHLLARARDSSAEVRRRVYAVLHEAGAESIRVLSIQQRVQLVRLGLQDRYVVPTQIPIFDAPLARARL
jgi:uncharacterized membrane protein